MRLSHPRIPTLDPAEWSDEQTEALGREIADLQASIGSGDTVFNILKTMVHHPALCKSWMSLTTHLLFNSSLRPREREILILRIGWLCQSGYEFGQHILISQEAGLSKEEIVRITKGADAPGWSNHERTLIQATDELHADAFITDGIYAQLAADYSQEQIMDLIFTVGQYNMLSMALNSLGVQLDPGIPEYREFVKHNA